MLFEHGASDPVQVLVPTQVDYDNLGFDWTGLAEPFDDSSWTAVSGIPNGVGYDRGSGAYDSAIGLDVESTMYEDSTTLFARAEFDVLDASAVGSLMLSVRYDDGFIVWLNGVEVTRANVAGVYPAWDARAESEYDSPITPVEFDVSEYTPLLHDGANVLAIRLFNDNPTGDDALLQFSLTGESFEGAPFAVDDVAKTLEGMALIDVLANDLAGSTPIGLLSVVIVTPPASGSAVLNPTGAVVYTPGPEFLGVDTFTYRVTDGVAVSNLATVTITVALSTPDFGDAPYPYPTTRAENGARHEIAGPMLGAARNVDTDGVHDVTASGDAADDGVVFHTIQVSQLGAAATVEVQNAPSGARLDAWIDFNGDGNWGTAGEQIASGVAMTEGSNAIRFDIPSWAVHGRTFARFRLSSAGYLTVLGAAHDGEVEDYAVVILPPEAGGGFYGGRKSISASADGATSVFATDMDDDGDMDVLSTSANDNRITWYENDGNQGFTTHTISSTAERARAVLAADMDRDGDLDVLAALPGENTIAWYENNGSQLFTPHSITVMADGVISVFAADLDSDGDLDVLSASFDDNRITWYDNDGAQAFSERNISTTAEGAASVSAADLDRDGDLDVLSASYLDDTIAWYENNGSQVFTRHEITIAADGATSVLAADMDGDGDLDVLAALNETANFTWFENNGFQAFTPHSTSVAAYGTESVFAADMDGDGDLDVLASTTDRSISWYENDGLGIFAERGISSGLESPTHVVAADMDGDADLDVLLASLSTDRVAWFENLPACSSCADAYSVHEDAALTIDAAAGVLANDGPLVDEILQSAVKRSPNHGLLELNADGAFSYVPEPDFYGIDSFTYELISDRRNPREVAVRITVDPAPDLPAANDDVYSVVAGGVLSSTVSANAQLVTLIPTGSTWSFADLGGDQDTAWRTLSFNDTLWRFGRAELGYGDGDEVTVVDCGPAPGNECDPEYGTVSNKYITTYFRRTFVVDDPERVAVLSLNLERDDGAVVYLNGVEVVRDNLPTVLPPGRMTADTLAIQPINEFTMGIKSIPSIARFPLVRGNNVLAVEIHQNSPTSSDISFDLELIATIQADAGVLANDGDVDGDLLSATLVAGPHHGTLEFQTDGSFVYYPDQAFTGVDEFAYRANDAQSSSEPTSVRIVVSPPGKLPEDLNADGVINAGDVAFLLANYGKASGAKSIEGDLDSNARIGVRDAIRLRNAFTPQSAPSAAAAIAARASDRAIVEAASVNLLRADRRVRRFGDILSTTRLVATDRALSAIVERSASSDKHLSRMLVRTRR